MITVIIPQSAIEHLKIEIDGQAIVVCEDGIAAINDEARPLIKSMLNAIEPIKIQISDTGSLQFMDFGDHRFTFK